MQCAVKKEDLTKLLESKNLSTVTTSDTFLWVSPILSYHGVHRQHFSLARRRVSDSASNANFLIDPLAMAVTPALADSSRPRRWSYCSRTSSWTTTSSQSPLVLRMDSSPVRSSLQWRLLFPCAGERFDAPEMLYICRKNI
jgi:hypothetical protein